MELAQDVFILLSFVNTKLRDEFSSLADFCEAYDCSPEYICERLSNIGYNYDPNLNKFI
jgi:hypothetical protein